MGVGIKELQMGKLTSLEEVSASVLPAKVLVMLSKYAQAMRKHTGLVIKISSMNVFKHVHNTHKLTQHPVVQQLHKELLSEVNTHIERGTMHTNHDREVIKRNRPTNTRPSSQAGEFVISSSPIVERNSTMAGSIRSVDNSSQAHLD